MISYGDCILAQQQKMIGILCVMFDEFKLKKLSCQDTHAWNLKSMHCIVLEKTLARGAKYKDDVTCFNAQSLVSIAPTEPSIVFPFLTEMYFVLVISETYIIRSYETMPRQSF